jgi:uncharacterized protein with gpF-like domain
MSVWGWRYHTQRDSRVRAAHEELEGATFKTGGEGDAVFPPWDWGCRCYPEWIDESEGEELTDEPLPPEVRQAFPEDYASPAIEDENRPDLSGYDARLLAHLANDQEGL